jgi:hypothetical protein
MSLRMQPRNERFFTLFQLGWLERRRECGHSHGVLRPRCTSLSMGGVILTTTTPWPHPPLLIRHERASDDRHHRISIRHHAALLYVAAMQMRSAA